MHSKAQTIVFHVDGLIFELGGRKTRLKNLVFDKFMQNYFVIYDVIKRSENFSKPHNLKDLSIIFRSPYRKSFYLS